MILESAKNVEKISYLSDGIKNALKEITEFLNKPYEVGKNPLGKGMTLIACEYDTKPLNDESKMEAHKQYIDLMYMVEGEEMIYVKDTEALCNITKEYDSSIEALLADVDGDVSAIKLTAGRFIVLYPQDAHCPSCCCKEPCNVRKIIVKVPITEG